jgi:HJR/Mrr/RecB family endonuclease
MKKMKNIVPILALLITIFLFATVLLVSSTFEQRRQVYLDTEMQKVYNSLNDMQIYMLMSDTYDQKMACIAYKEKLRDLDKTTWQLGQKIDQYRAASEEFRKDPYYLQQKQVFNENEMLYLLLLKKVKETCDMQQSIIIFFYQNSDDCKKCDDQSFILTDIHRDIDKDAAIFSFDIDLNLTTVRLLREYYDVKELPCVVIDDHPYCGIQGRDFIVGKICENVTTLPQCQTQNASG